MAGDLRWLTDTQPAEIDNERLDVGSVGVSAATPARS
jgi:hypothetical protein